MRLIDLKGKFFGKLFVMWRAPRRYGIKSTLWECLCECGNTTVVSGTELREGMTVSCGCHKRDLHTKHNLSHHPLYDTWKGIRHRCNNPDFRDYPRYGGRGIKMDPRWDDPVKFIDDVGPRPSRLHSIDRKDNDGDYTPENVRWATKKEQSRNTSANVVITYEGVTKTVTEWAEELGVPRTNIYAALRRGLSFERIVFLAKRRRRV